LGKTYIVIHDETVDVITAFCPDFPGVRVPGDRWSDTLTMMPIVLQQHVDKMLRRGETLPTPTVPDLWELCRNRLRRGLTFTKQLLVTDIPEGQMN
jgi:predicted RNase H-like HicB family nuclease